MESKLDTFINMVEQKNIFQSKYLLNNTEDITTEEKASFDALLTFYMSYFTCSMENIVDKYLRLTEFFREEQLYFIRNDRYRFSTFLEVENYYKNYDYMDCYTVGLGLSVYLWKTHRNVLHFFDSFLKYPPPPLNTDRTYFEIGPGHGEYMVYAMKNTNYHNYMAVDISETSVALTKDYINYSHIDTNKQYAVLHKDFFDFTDEKKFDCIVMGEVLEHVENPNYFLKKIRSIAKNDAHIFITTAINAPQPDHIYHFKHLNEVIHLFEKNGFLIMDHIAVNAKGYDLEKAEKKKIPIVCGFILRPL